MDGSIVLYTAFRYTALQSFQQGRPLDTSELMRSPLALIQAEGFESGTIIST